MDAAYCFSFWPNKNLKNPLELSFSLHEIALFSKKEKYKILLNKKSHPKGQLYNASTL